MESAGKKYDDILNKAQELFWKHGIKRVTVEEICKEAEVSKMTFYRYFSNKLELAKAVIKHVFDDGMEQYRELMKSDDSFEKKIEIQLLKKFEGTREVASEFVNDVYNEFPDLKTYWEQRRDEILHEVLKDYAIAQKNGWMRRDIKLEFILYINSKMTEMTTDKDLLAMYDNNMQEVIMELTKLFFYGILPHGNKS